MAYDLFARKSVADFMDARTPANRHQLLQVPRARGPIAGIHRGGGEGELFWGHGKLKCQ